MAKNSLLILLFVALPVQAQKHQGDLECKLTGTDFVYDCVVRITPPTPGVQVTVGADMPAMPMAHNIRPVKAQPGKKPGEYRVRLELEMRGEWAVKLRLSGPVRDQLILHYDFTESGTVRRK